MCGERDQVAESIRHSSLTYGNIQQTLALCFLVIRKHNRAETKNTANYTNTQLQAEDHFTSHEIEDFREEANTMLSQFAANLVHPKEKPSFWFLV